jgi:hypothetical protein
MDRTFDAIVTIFFVPPDAGFGPFIGMAQASALLRVLSLLLAKSLKEDQFKWVKRGASETG